MASVHILVLHFSRLRCSEALEAGDIILFFLLGSSLPFSMSCMGVGNLLISILGRGFFSLRI
jgi:hypothetical protein